MDSNAVNSHASILRRLVAPGIDYIVSMNVMMFVMTLIMDLDNLDTLFIKVLILVASTLLSITAKDIFGGKSVGKLIVGISVKSEKDSKLRPSIFALFIRNISLTLGIFELAALVNSPTNQRRGDKFAKTIVVNDQKRLPQYGVIIAIIAIIALSISVLYLSINTMVKSSDAYILTEKYVRSNENILQKVGNIKDVDASSSNVNNTN